MELPNWPTDDCDRLGRRRCRFQPRTSRCWYSATSATAHTSINGPWVAPAPVFDDWYAESLRNAVTTLGTGGARVAISTRPVLPGLFGDRDMRGQLRQQIDGDVRGKIERRAPVDLGAYVCPTHDTCRQGAAGSRATARRHSLRRRQRPADRELDAAATHAIWLINPRALSRMMRRTSSSVKPFNSSAKLAGTAMPSACG